MFNSAIPLAYSPHLMLPDTVKQQQNASVGNGVQHKVALASGRQNALIFQNAKLLADKRLTDSRRLRNLRDRAGPLLLTQKVQNPQARWMCGIPNDGSDPFQRFHVNKRHSIVVLYYHDIVIPLYK